MPLEQKLKCTREHMRALGKIALFKHIADAHHEVCVWLATLHCKGEYLRLRCEGRTSKRLEGEHENIGDKPAERRTGQNVVQKLP